MNKSYIFGFLMKLFIIHLNIMSIECFLNIDLSQDTCLEVHNKYRKVHDAQPLTTNESLVEEAKKRAQRIAELDIMSHDGSKKGLGENIFYAKGYPNIDCDMAVRSWYSEVKEVDFDKQVYPGSTGHFTQVVWKNTKSVGCGKAVSSSQKVYIVCEYFPAGNYRNQYSTNVGKPLDTILKSTSESSSQKKFNSTLFRVILIHILLIVQTLI